MKRPTLALLAFALLASAALPARAALEKYKDWDKSPEYQYLATDVEKKDFKKLTSDADVEKFIALFWARRHPNIETNPQNVFREQFEARVKYADEHFALGRKRGALTERGQALVLIGPPKSSARRGAATSSQDAGGPTGAATGAGGPIRIEWHYEKDQLPPWAGLSSLDIAFEIDQAAFGERLVDASTTRRLEKKAVEVALVDPNRKELPVYKTKEQAEAEQKAAVEAAKGPALAPASRAAIDALPKEPSGPLALLSLAYRDGATRLHVQLYAPASAVGTGEGVRLAILARAADGSEAARVDEDAKLRKSGSDFFADRALRVLPGEFDVAAVLLDVAGKVLVSGRRSATVSALPTEFATSPLVIAVNDFPLDAPKPDDPFTFSARRFVAKGDGKLDATDGLSYALRIYNPPVDPVSSTVTLKRTIKIKAKGQPAIDVPTPPAEPQKVPEEKGAGALILDLAGGIIETNLGQYLKPNDYELRVSLVDPASQKKVEVSAPFTVVGTLPAPAAPPAPKKKG
jgi:GWxTD domain-containing protein